MPFATLRKRLSEKPLPSGSGGVTVAFWGVALLLIVVPGADWAFTLSAGLRDRSVVPAVGGLVLGYGGMTVVVAAGVGAFVAENPAALTTLTVLGGGYLVLHGVRTLASPSAPLTATGDAAAEAQARTGWATIARAPESADSTPRAC
ncbi:LysE family transporter [Microbispora sp. GKU 823]|uniref:LysE family transporter n=1 Tax=Microbispora sp. GKU 823 TaxID=1652100 RepID=UPI00211736E7|nr:LysE family transporter [Microbispora sp. GKU 823]